MVECLRVSGWLSIVDTGQIYTYNGLTSQTQVHTYAFTTASTFSGSLTLDATDRAGNLTAEPFSITYDNVAPTPPTITVPSAAPATFSLSWSGQDSGAGVRHYDVQVRDAITSTWTPWLTGTTSTEAQFTGSPGHSYYFQVRATDQVNNTGAWQQAGPVAIRSVTKYYTFGSQRVAMRQGDEVYYLHGDHLGSTSLTTDGSGAVMAESRYLPYGQERWRSGAAVTDFGFTGQRHEAGFGLMDYNARYYDPLLGRFVSADTVVPKAGNPQNWNRYSYVVNNPLKYNDPGGHCQGLAGAAFDACAAVVLTVAPAVHKANEYSEDIFFPDANTTFADRLEASTVVGGGATLIAAAAVEVVAGTLTTAATTSSATAVGTAGTGTAVAARQAAARLNVQSLWDLNPFRRGVEIENIIGRSPNLAQNFPTIDRFQNGVATSIKSIDLTAQTYQNLTTLNRTVMGYVNTMANYQGQTAPWGGVSILPSQITGRAIDLAIPASGVSQTQMGVLQMLQQQAIALNVNLNIIPIP